MSFMATALLLAWVAIVLLALSVAGLMRQVHLLLTERSADGTAAPAPTGPRMLPADLRRSFVLKHGRDRRGENDSNQECPDHLIGPLLWPLRRF